MPSKNELRQRRLPRGVRAHRLRPLRSQRHRREQAVPPGTLRHGGTGRLWSIEASIIPDDRCLPYLLLCGQSSLLSKRKRGVGTRTEGIRTKCTLFINWDSDWSPRWPQNISKTEWYERKTCMYGARTETSKRDRSMLLCGMFSFNPEGIEDCFRWGYHSHFNSKETHG